MARWYVKQDNYSTPIVMLVSFIKHGVNNSSDNSAGATAPKIKFISYYDGWDNMPPFKSPSHSFLFVASQSYRH